jgi:hypothetical protein
MEHFLHAHFEDHVGMGTDPHATRCHVTQQRVENDAVVPLGEGVDPDEDTVATEKLLAYPIRHIVGIERGFGFDTERGYRLENAMKPVALRRFSMPLRGIPGPEEC